MKQSDYKRHSELVEVLTAISVVSERLARNMSVLAAENFMKGENRNEQNKRNGNGNRRTAKCRRSY